MSQDTKPTVETITLNDGIAWTDNWRNSDRKLNADSFLLSADDFRAILKEPTIAFVRLYVGLEVSEEKDKPGADEKNVLLEKLICVGVDNDRKDILGVGKQIDQSGFIYDFSHPCPPLCQDPESPLAGGNP